MGGFAISIQDWRFFIYVFYTTSSLKSNRMPKEGEKRRNGLDVSINEERCFFIPDLGIVKEFKYLL